MDFCTYFDSGYLTRGLALYQSLATHARSFRLFVLALDDETADILRRLQLPGLIPITLDEIQAVHPELTALRQERSPAGFFMTLTPLLVARVFARDISVQRLAYLDADLMFFANPELVWDREVSIGLIEHRFPPGVDKAEIHGRFNVGMVAFTRCAEAGRCIERWSQQCLDWCEPVPVDGRFGDQKYLDEWPALYPGLTIFDHPGANLAPWNVDGHRLESDGRGGLLVDGKPLVFFHFSSFKQLLWRFHYAGLGDSKVAPILRLQVLKPYAKMLRHSAQIVEPLTHRVSKPRADSIRVAREILSFFRWRRLEFL